MMTESNLLIQLASTNVELFHTPQGDGHAMVPINNHRVAVPIRTKEFRQWLRRSFYQKHGTPPKAQALREALDVLEAQAQFDCPEQPVFIRVAGVDDKIIYLDLANAEGGFVEITSTGWRVVDKPPVRFRRAPGMVALPQPVSGGSIEAFRPFVNVPDESEWRLLVAWLVAALRPVGPYPILILEGEQGSAKSTTARLLRALVDPSTSPLKTLQRDTRDLMIRANNSWVLAFDNLSDVPAAVSDALCRLATGGGFSTRKLYTDADEQLFDAQRPIIMNGISIMTRQDLADRALFLSLPPIRDGNRRDERRFWRDFEALRPRILGALCDAVSAALHNLPYMNLPEVPRMADFALWVSAAEEGLQWSAGTFLEAYQMNRQEAIVADLDVDPVAVAVRELLKERMSWCGTATELLPDLERYAPVRSLRSRDWPTSPRAFAGRLRRVAPALRAVGMEVNFGRKGHGGRRLIEMWLVEPSLPSPSSPDPRHPSPHQDAMPRADGNRDEGSVT